MLSASLVSLLALSGSHSLSRGAMDGSELGYWAVSDSFVDASVPSKNFGRDPLLSGGPGKVILIRFSGLGAALGAAKKVAAASLVLNQEIGEEPRLEGIYRINQRWGEGPDRRGVGLYTVPMEAGAKSPSSAVTWEDRFGGLKPQRWQAAGLKGTQDTSLIRDVTTSYENGRFAISGLGEAVQEMLSRPWENNGFAVIFKNQVDFSSSEALGARPTLEVLTEDLPATSSDLAIETLSTDIDFSAGFPANGTPVKWTVGLKNHGDATTGPVEVTFDVMGTPMVVSVPAISPKGSATADATIAFERVADPRKRLVSVVAKGTASDLNPANNSWDGPEMSFPITVALRPEDKAKLDSQGGAGAWLSSGVRFLNDTGLPQSRFSFALDGCTTSVRLQRIIDSDSALKISTFDLRTASRLLLSSLGCSDLSVQQISRSSTTGRASNDPFPGIMGGGDTRDETGLPTVLGVVAEPWLDPSFALVMPQPTGLLSATELGFIQAKLVNPNLSNKSMIPDSAMIRVLSENNQLLRAIKIDLYPSSESGQFSETPSLSLDAKAGVAQVPQLKALIGDSPVVMVKITRDGESAVTFIKRWQLVDAFARGNTDSAMVALKVSLPDGPILRNSNIAKGRFVSDSANRPPALLASLTDEDNSTSVPITGESGSWIEIDLQKDRTIGEIVLNAAGGNLPEKFRISTYQTGQRIDSARPWATEIAGLWMIANRGTGDEIAYHGPARLARFIRIDFLAGRSGQITEVKVFGLKQ